MNLLKHSIPVTVFVQLVFCTRNIYEKGPGLAPNILKIPDTYHDIFLPGSSGHSTFGTPRATCWARGGICVPVNQCRGLKFADTVTGCIRGYRVCCKVHRFGSPTVGVQRNGPEIVIYSSNLDGFNKQIVFDVARMNKNVLDNFLNNHRELNY